MCEWPVLRPLLLLLLNNHHTTDDKNGPQESVCAHTDDRKSRRTVTRTVTTTSVSTGEERCAERGGWGGMRGWGEDWNLDSEGLRAWQKRQSRDKRHPERERKEGGVVEQRTLRAEQEGEGEGGRETRCAEVGKGVRW